MSNRIEISDRLVYWTEAHPRWKPNPEWPEEVGCVLYATDDALVLIDPLIRDDLDVNAWSWLDASIEAHGRPVELPAGIETFTPGGRDEGQVAFWVPDQRALVVAEFFAERDGGLTVLVSPAETDLPAFAESLEGLRALPIEYVLVAHGAPVIGGGSEAIAAALDDFGATRLP